ncbi:hypothetical protein [Micavibrio aeruginosavorus]|uniref:Uncharacterized protein n=1 Tax=Micavibrio aeruginosavorus EPB TaxID=349215 RepID=M4VFC5_9BACT|nr:hypothetical protein [Micavibrio aeruginosavorus]AGH97185.1 hypothetical protein A11S_350 [Micavibrio aeruginosavorus EPB]
MTQISTLQTTLRDQFHDTILPRTPDQTLHPVQAQMAKAILGSLITRAGIVAATDDITATCAVLGTTPAILNDLKDYFNQHGKNRALAERIITAQTAHNRTAGITATASVRALGFGGWSC